MERVTIDAVDRVPDSATVKRPLSRALGATNVALNHYELAPGDSFAYGYHRHSTQEEVFVVERGTVTFETEEDEVDVDVGAGEVVRFAPGEFQQGVNRGDDRVVALAIGAPQDSGDVVILRDCPNCGERTSTTVEWADDGDAKVTRCQECDAETGRFT